MTKPKHFKIKILGTLLYGAILILGWFTVGVPCPFKLIFGIPCPLCGMTRAFVSLLKLDFSAAFEYNAMVWSLPILYLLFLFDGKIFKNKYANTAVLALISAGFVINWLLKLL